MKIKHLVMIGLLLAMITMGAVSASQSDNLTDTDLDSDVLAESDEMPLQDEGDDVYVYVQENVYQDSDSFIAQAFKHIENPKGNFSVYMDDELCFNKELVKCNYDDEYSCYYVTLKDLNKRFAIGNYTILAKYDDGVKNPITDSGNLLIDDPVKMYLYDYVYLGDDLIFDVFDYHGLNGTLKILMNGVECFNTTYLGEYDSHFIHLTDLRLPSDFTFGRYDVKVIYNRTGTEKPYVSEGQVEVTYFFYFGYDDEDLPNIYESDVDFGQGMTLLVMLPKNATGNVVVTFNGKTYTVTPKQGVGHVTLKTDGLRLGKHVAYATYSDSYYPTKKVNFTINVTPMFYYGYPMAQGGVNYLIFEVPKDYKGKVSIYSEKYDSNYNLVKDKLLASGNVKNGMAILKFTAPTTGSNFLVSYSYGNYVYDEEIFILTEKNTKGYSSSINSNLFVSGEKVTVTFNGKASNDGVEIYVDGNLYKRISLSKGKFSHTVKGLGIGSHVISVYYKNNKDNVYINNFLVTIKSVKDIKLTLKKVKVKRSAKKLILTATLKIGGKTVMGKVIKFKFNKKTYKAKTNKKGVAKVTIKKSVLKKLKRGKKLTYTANYSKVTKKVKVKVKR